MKNNYAIGAFELAGPVISLKNRGCFKYKPSYRLV